MKTIELIANPSRVYGIGRKFDPPEIGVKVKQGHYPLAWLAGGRRAVLDECPSERAFYSGLGAAVAFTAMLSGFAVMLAVAYVERLPIQREWLIGAVWTVVIANLERLIAMGLTSRRHFGIALPRVGLSVALSILIAIPMILWLLGPEISAKLAANTEAAIQKSTKNVDNFYGPKIASDQQQIAALQAQESSLQGQINQNLFLESCETGETDCSTTHQLGAGPYAQHYAQLASTEQAQLTALKSQDQPRIATLAADISSLTQSENTQSATGSSANANDTGLVAREEALGSIEKGHSGIQELIWLLSIVFIALDLVPVGVKLAHVWNGDSAYEAVSLSLRRKDLLAAKRIERRNEIEEARINEEAEAEMEVDRVRIEVDRDQRIAEEEGSWYGGRSSSTAHRSSEPRIQAINLDEFVSSIHHYESQPVAVPQQLALGAWIGTAIITVCTAGLFWDSARLHHPANGMWLGMGLLAGAVSLAAYTRGFRRAPAWALRACFAVLVTGLLLPLALFIID